LLELIIKRSVARCWCRVRIWVKGGSAPSKRSLHVVPENPPKAGMTTKVQRTIRSWVVLNWSMHARVQVAVTLQLCCGTAVVNLAVGKIFEANDVVTVTCIPGSGLLGLNWQPRAVLKTEYDRT
jgi:hypothetical protein